MLVFTEQKKSRLTKRRHVQESSSSSESSSEDVELDLTDSSEEETTKKEECAIPSIDLWIPTQTNTQESNKERYQTPSLFSPASEVPSATGDKDKVADKPPELNTLLRGIARPYSTDIVVRNPAEIMSKVNPGILSLFLMGLELSCCSKECVMSWMAKPFLCLCWLLSRYAIGGCCWKLNCGIEHKFLALTPCALPRK